MYYHFFFKKKELVTRGVGFSDCFEKHELVARLVEARLQVHFLYTKKNNNKNSR